MTHNQAVTVAALAWNRVKPEGDPPFHLCHETHQSRLVYKVECVGRTRKTEDAFDEAALDIMLNPPPEPEPVAAVAEEAVAAPSESPAVVEEAPIEESKPKTRSPFKRGK